MRDFSIVPRDGRGREDKWASPPTDILASLRKDGWSLVRQDLGSIDAGSAQTSLTTHSLQWDRETLGSFSPISFNKRIRALN